MPQSGGCGDDDPKEFGAGHLCGHLGAHLLSRGRRLWATFVGRRRIHRRRKGSTFLAPEVHDDLGAYKAKMH